MEAGFVLILVFLIVGVGVLAWYIAGMRARALAPVAARLGFSFSGADPFGLLEIPFPLFSEGDEQEVGNVMWGTRDGHAIKEFDFTYTVTNPSPKIPDSTYIFSCALAELPAACPYTTIARETISTRLADKIGLRDLEFESEEFNRAFNVTSNDPKFASYLVDARMMQWLLEADADCTFETWDRYVLCTTDRLRARDVEWVILAVERFCERIPGVVLDVYGRR